MTYDQRWDQYEKTPGEHGIVRTYNTLSHDLYKMQHGGRQFELWYDYRLSCTPCISQLPAELSNDELFPKDMALPLRVIDCFYFVDANGREWHSPIESKLSIKIVRDPARQGPPPGQVLEWPPR